MHRQEDAGRVLDSKAADTKTHEHKPNSAAFYFVSTYHPERNKYYQYNGEECVVKMLRKLIKLSDRCIEEMGTNQELKLTRAEEKEFRIASNCCLCNKEFDTENNYKVRDHCHRTGQYRGVCCRGCNINLLHNRYFPVFFHNLRGYDSHVILRKACDLVDQKKISVIPQSTEKLMTFTIGDLKFLDTMQFMPASLEELSNNLKTKNQDDKFQLFHNVKSFFNQEELELICQKRVYPYEYIDREENFKEE
jgi:hypothetical protein